jgi:hypothetical protein
MRFPCYRCQGTATAIPVPRPSDPDRLTWPEIRIDPSRFLTQLSAGRSAQAVLICGTCCALDRPLTGKGNCSGQQARNANRYLKNLKMRNFNDCNLYHVLISNTAISQCTALFEKLTVTQLVKKFLCFLLPKMHYHVKEACHWTHEPV